MIRNDVSWADYLAIKRMNPSTLVCGLPANGGMRNLRHVMSKGFEDTSTKAKRIGSGVHSLTLEPEEFEQRFVVVPAFELDADNLRKPKRKDEPIEDRRSDSKATDYYKRRVSEFMADNKGKEHLSRSEYDTALCCIEAIRECDEAREIIERAGKNKEVTIEGVIEGVPSKGRLDLLIPSEISDIKTMGFVDHDSVKRAVINLDYLVKLAFYRELVRQHSCDRAVSIIAVQNGGCFDCAVYNVPSEYIDWGWQQVANVMKDYKRAVEFDEWFGVNRGMGRMTLHLPHLSAELDAIPTRFEETQSLAEVTIPF
jgi:hypothetical protein